MPVLANFRNVNVIWYVVSNVQQKQIMETTIVRDRFKVVAVSTNTNSFGLSQFVIVNKSGKAYRAHANYLNCPKQGTFIEVPLSMGRTSYNFAIMGFEVPEEIEAMPKDVVKAVW